MLKILKIIENFHKFIPTKKLEKENADLNERLNAAGDERVAILDQGRRRLQDIRGIIQDIYNL